MNHHTRKLEALRKFEREFRFVNDYWQQRQELKRREHPTDDQRKFIALVDRMVDWFQERYGCQWEQVLQRMEGKAR